MKEFEKLVEQYTPFVMSVCLSFMKHREDAEDACQEVFLKIWKTKSGFLDRSKYTTWLYSIARNTCLDILKKNSRHEHDEIPETLPDNGTSPESRLVEKEFEEAVYSALEELDTDMKTILLLREKAGLSYTDIASLLAISEGTVKSRISRAREKLMKILREKNIT